MKQFVIAGTLAGALAMGGTALAQTPPPAAPTPRTPPAAPAEAKPADQAEKPAPRAPRARRAPAGDNSRAGHAAPKAQPNTAPEPEAPGAMSLGTVRLPRGVKLDGKSIDAGSYQVRLTAEEAKPDAKGSSEKLERWVEFLKGSSVVGREVVSIVPASETKLVQKDAPPRPGGSKVETLKGGDYVRVWINRGGTYYLVHLPNG